MMTVLEERIPELEQMQRYPDTLYYVGNKALFKRPKLSIVGSRKPTPYTKYVTSELAANVIYNNKLESTVIN